LRGSFRKVPQRTICSRDTDWDTPTILDKAKNNYQETDHSHCALIGSKPQSSHFTYLAQIAWKLRRQRTGVQALLPPFLLATTQGATPHPQHQLQAVPANQLLATEVSKIMTPVILEALHNCIALGLPAPFTDNKSRH
jgi:hypothetical protein